MNNNLLTFRDAVKSKSWPLVVCCAVFIALVLSAVIIFVSTNFLQSQTVVTLTESGFYPSELEITEGDTIRFVSKTGYDFWPASDSHPGHTDYPDFDPRQPVPADQEWQHTFSEAGVYNYHDHINPLFEGVVLVKNSAGEVPAVDCATSDSPQCWQRLILETLNQQGTVAAFNVISDLSKRNRVFNQECHTYSHLVGEYAYDLFVQDKNFEVTSDMSACGYGFYHGFMETLLLTSGDITEAQAFCDELGSRMSHGGQAASAACFHGSGHGAVDGSDPTAWGDIDALIEPGFKLCAVLARNSYERYLCDTGVFNSIEILSEQPKYDIRWLREDPFTFCNEQPVERREACYSNMIPILLEITNNSVRDALRLAYENMISQSESTVNDVTVRELVTTGIVFEFIRLNQSSDSFNDEATKLCNSLAYQDRVACVQGMAGGFIKYAEVGNEYAAAITFCNTEQLTSSEQEHCFSYVLPRMNARYDSNVVNELCEMVPNEYKDRGCPVRSNDAPESV